MSSLFSLIISHFLFNSPTFIENGAITCIWGGEVKRQCQIVLLQAPAALIRRNMVLHLYLKDASKFFCFNHHTTAHYSTQISSSFLRQRQNKMPENSESARPYLTGLFQ